MNDSDKELRTLAGAVARALGATLKPVSPECPDRWPALVMPDGPELTLHTHYQTKRVVVSQNLPTITERDGAPRHQSTRDLVWQVKKDHGERELETSITCDPKRGAETIAKDIARRLLPSAIIWHGAALKRKAESEAHGQGINQTLTKLAKALKCEPRHGTHLYPGSVSLQVTAPDHVSIERVYCTAETAIAIVKLLRAEKPD